MAQARSEAASSAGTALAAPLVTPAGMNDLLPPEAAARRALSQRVLRSFELAGYELCMPPVFEHAEVLERGNGALESRDLLRFVEPESGEVAVLRPDITPQIARIVATRLTERPPPFRLCYEGRVFRRQRGRARSHRQISQAGVECVGLSGPLADAEVIALALRACRDAGLSQFRAELSDIRLVRSLLAEIPDALRGAASEVIARKDAAALSTLLRGHAAAEPLRELLDHYGDREVLERARETFRSEPAQTALANLLAITERLSELGFERHLCFDLGETRGLAYYTGVHFGILGDGPGEAIGGGGRYDGLLARFGLDAPATGFALDLGNLQWTLRAEGASFGRGSSPRVVVSGGDERQVSAAAEALRRADLVAATLAETNQARCLAFARAWGYDAVVTMTRGAGRLLRVADGASRTLVKVEPDVVRQFVRGARTRSSGPLGG
jgi:ATP phosphoribosyltransferase regulatory subunit